MQLVTYDHKRVGIVVEPTLLADALAMIIVADGRHEVIPASELSSTRLDALVANYGGGQDLAADVVIELPEAGTSTGISRSGTNAGRIRTRHGVFDVRVNGTTSVLELIDRYCP